MLPEQQVGVSTGAWSCGRICSFACLFVSSLRTGAVVQCAAPWVAERIEGGIVAGGTQLVWC